MSVYNVLLKQKKIIKFAIVGVSSTLIDLGILYVLHDLFRVPLFFSVSVAFVCAVINGFVRNKFRTFGDASTKYKRQFVKFFIVSSGGLCLTLLCMYLFVDICHIYYLLAKVITSLIVMSWNFLLNKFWTFRIQDDKRELGSDTFSLMLSVIVPAYNEEKRIPDTLHSISTFLEQKGISYEVIVVDDGSSDNTVQIVEDLSLPHIRVVKNDKNRGKGYSVKHGVSLAVGEYILFTDADNSTPIEELDSLMKHIDTHEVVIGSRYCEGSKVEKSQGKMRLLIGRIGNFLIRSFLIDGIVDTQCGFKLFQHKVAKKVFSLQKIYRFGFDMEILLAAQSLGYAIKEVPVARYNSEESRVRPFRDALRTFFELLYIKINFWFDGYK